MRRETIPGEAGIASARPRHTLPRPRPLNYGTRHTRTPLIIAFREVGVVDSCIPAVRKSISLIEDKRLVGDGDLKRRGGDVGHAGGVVVRDVNEEPEIEHHSC